MFQQQSPDSQHPTHFVYPRLYDGLRNKNELSEFYNYDLNSCNGVRNPSSYLSQTPNQEFSDLKSNPNFINNCNLLHPVWPNHLDSIPRPQMSYHPMNYSQCNYSHFTNATGNQYQMPPENTVLWEQMKSMAIDPVHIHNYQKLNIDDYNAMLATQYSKNDLNPSNREKECVRCGVITGSAWQKDNNGHFLCLNCFRSNSYVSSTLDMISPYKRNQLNKNLARKQTAKRTGLLCSNCKTENTTLWRRNVEGQPVCNACGLYYRLHKTHRPPSMRKETLQTRKRKTKKKQNMCMKFMDQEYPIKPELTNSMDQQIMSSPFSSAPVHISAHCLSTDKFDSSFRHHGFDLSQPPSNIRSSNVNDIVHPISSLPHHNGFDFMTQ